MNKSVLKRKHMEEANLILQNRLSNKSSEQPLFSGNVEKSNQRKLNYFKNIFLPRFEEIKKIHGLNFTIELLNNIALEVDEVTED